MTVELYLQFWNFKCAFPCTYSCPSLPWVHGCCGENRKVVDWNLQERMQRQVQKLIFRFCRPFLAWEEIFQFPLSPAGTHQLLYLDDLAHRLLQEGNHPCGAALYSLGSLGTAGTPNHRPPRASCTAAQRPAGGAAPGGSAANGDTFPRAAEVRDSYLHPRGSSRGYLRLEEYSRGI